MVQMALFTLREGIEAFLIVAIALAYLRTTSREALAPAVYWGAVAALLLSLILGVWLAEIAITPLWEALLAAVATVLVITMVIYMTRHARHFASEIRQHIDAQAVKPSAAAWWGVFAFIVLMVTREGMEVAFVTNALLGKEGDMQLAAGAFIGIAAAAALAWAWARYGHRVNLKRFFQVTSIFLVIFAIQLLLYAFHELTEAQVLPIDNVYWHNATEAYGPEGIWGQALTYLMVLVPAAWLAFAALRGERLTATQSSRMPPAR